MRLSVILSTYNAPALLEKVLCGYSRQTHRDFEIVVADDGSTDETARLLERLAGELDLAIRHVWHEDDGFRKCAILNRAIGAAAADYLVFSDGDCIPRDDFLAVHARLAARGRFLSGGYFKLSREVSEALTPERVLAGDATAPHRLRELGTPASLRFRMRLAAGPALARLLDAVTPTRPSWNGHNASGWKNDLVAANGFDERMRYGGEDRELGERLVNAGLRGLQIRHRAVCVHLWHERGYVREGDLEANLAIRRETERTGAERTAYGIDRGVAL